MTTTKTQLTLPVPKNLAIGFMIAASIGFLSGGFTLGVLAGHGMRSTVASKTTGTSDTTGTSGTSGNSGTSGTHGPFVVGTAVSFKTPVDTLSGHRTVLARGSKATIIMAMASWCLYCGYEDKWVLPVLAKTPGVTVDIVDVSPQGGVADPGPKSPPFSGHDGRGGALTLAGMESTMQQYVKTYGTLSSSNIHVYVAPRATQSAWNIQGFPTLAFVGSSGKVAVAPPGAQTFSQAQADLHQALGH